MRKKRLACLLLACFVLMTMFALQASAASLGVSTSVSPESMDAAGNITIALSLTNNGDVQLENVTLVMENGQETALGNIEPGEKRSFDVSNFPVSEEDIGGTIALTFAWFENGSWESMETQIEIKEKEAEPELTFTRTASEKSGKKGDTITLKYSVKNSGDVRVNGISIVDPIKGEPIAENFDLRPGRSDSFTYDLTLEDSVQSKPVVTGTAENGTPIRIELESLPIAMRNNSLQIVVTAGAASDAGTAFDVHVTNNGNTALSQITLQDDAGAIVEDGLRLGAGEDVHYTHTVSAVEERELRIKATCIEEGFEDDRLSFESDGVAVSPGYQPSDIKLTATAKADKTQLDAPGDVNVTIELKNESPVPVYQVELSELGAGALQTIERIDVGETVSVEQKMQIAQSGQLTFAVHYLDGDKRPYSADIPEIGIAMAEATPSATPTQALPSPQPVQTKNGQVWILIAMGVIALLLIAAIIALIAVLVQHRRKKQRAWEDEAIVARETARPDAAKRARPRGNPSARADAAPPPPAQKRDAPYREKPKTARPAAPFAQTMDDDATVQLIEDPPRKKEPEPRRAAESEAFASGNLRDRESRPQAPRQSVPSESPAPRQEVPRPKGEGIVLGGGKPSRAPIAKDIAGRPEEIERQQAERQPQPEAPAPKPRAKNDDDYFASAFLDGEE